MAEKHAENKINLLFAAYCIKYLCILLFLIQGKNLERIILRALPPFMDKGYRLTLVLVDNIPDIAIERAAGRYEYRM